MTSLSSPPLINCAQCSCEVSTISPLTSSCVASFETPSTLYGSFICFAESSPNWPRSASYHDTRLMRDEWNCLGPLWDLQRLNQTRCALWSCPVGLWPTRCLPAAAPFAPR